MPEARRASPTDFRTALVRAEEHLPPRGHVRAGDLLGQGGEVLSVGTSLLAMAARFSDAGS